MLEQHLAQFSNICSATEVVLFEKTTFLVISRSSKGATIHSRAADDGFVYDEEEEGMEGFHDTTGRTAGSGAGLGSGFITSSNRTVTPAHDSNGQLNPERFEKISELVKNFKLSCS